MTQDHAKTHFEEFADEWLEKSYDGAGHFYPTALRRAEAVVGILADYDAPLRIADLGCGGGNLSVLLAAKGHKVTGFDQSKTMLANAERQKADLPAEIAANVGFVETPVQDIPSRGEKYDVVIAMGLIGYFDSDDVILDIARQLLNDGGIFIVSCRNRLFNMNSLSFRTVNEIENGTATALIEEIQECYQTLDDAAARAIVPQLRIAADMIEGQLERTAEAPRQTPATDKEDMPFEPRQSTPKGIARDAARFGFEEISVRGIHPHLIDPNLNKLLSPGLFTELCRILEPLSTSPVARVWSSVFISVFRKTND